MTAAPLEPARSRPLELLPIPTGDHQDIGAGLRAEVSSLKPRIDILIGPDDSGKSALLRTLSADHRLTSHKVQFLDLSVANWRDLATHEVASVQVLLIDHIDRVNESDHFSAAFDLLDRVIPSLFAAGPSVLTITLGQEWREAFRSIYRMLPETLLQRSIPTLTVRLHYIRPYNDAELAELCHNLGLESQDFADAGLRRAGVMAMASAAASEPTRLGGASLREVLAMRWVQAGHDSPARKARKAMWELMGSRILREGVFNIGLAELYAEFRASFATATLRDQVGGPIRWEEDQLQPDSPSWGDVAAAMALDGLIKGRSTALINAPIRSTVLDALIDLNGRATLATQVERRLQSLEGADFSSAGYLGTVLATLLPQVSQKEQISFQGLHLQGPDHDELRTIGLDIAQAVEDALIAALEEDILELLEILRQVTHASVSAYRGGYECWEAVRAWAKNLPLRAVAEDVVSQLLPHDGSWHYEDILDVSVTQATTRLMTVNAAAFEEALHDCSSPIVEYLADIWDGVNDGAWDQIDGTSTEFISSLKLHDETGKIFDIVGCRIQRARLGSQDVEHWRLIDCDIFLADFRSCRNVERADLSGSNWWSAILPPPARYQLSRESTDDRFQEWCQSPPWKNPYFLTRWPTPFEQPRLVLS